MADYNFEKERREAAEAGERALGSLRKAKQNLDNVFADWMVQTASIRQEARLRNS